MLYSSGRYKTYLFINSFCCCFSVIRYGPAGDMLSARETLTVCASSNCLQMIQKLCAFIWSEGVYYLIAECIDLSKALGSSEFCTVISSADSVLRPQSFYFANSHFLPQSHNNLYPTYVISQSKLSSTLRCRMSVGLKKSALTYSSHNLFHKARWKHCHTQDIFLHTSCGIFKWLLYLHIYQTDVFSRYDASHCFFSILRNECRI